MKSTKEEMLVGKIIAIIAFGLSVVSLVSTITSLWWILVLSFLATILISIIGMLIERKIRKRGTSLINRLFYYLGKNKDYIFTRWEYTYSYQADGSYQSKTYLEGISKDKNTRKIQRRFLWSSNSDNAEILATQSGQSIKGKRLVNTWTHYSIELDKGYERNKKFVTGSTVYLPPPLKPPLPFLSVEIDRKTKLLVLKAEIPKDLPHPQTAIFEVQVGGNVVGEPIPIPYDTSIEGYTWTVDFPRKGWKYSISWEEDDSTGNSIDSNT